MTRFAIPFGLFFVLYPIQLKAAEMILYGPNAESLALETLRRGGSWTPRMAIFDHPAFHSLPGLLFYLEAPGKMGGTLRHKDIDAVLSGILSFDCRSVDVPCGIKQGPDAIEQKRHNALAARRPYTSSQRSKEAGRAFEFLQKSFWWDYYRLLHSFFELAQRDRTAAQEIAERVKATDALEEKMAILRAGLMQ